MKPLYWVEQRRTFLQRCALLDSARQDGSVYWSKRLPCTERRLREKLSRTLRLFYSPSTEGSPVLQRMFSFHLLIFHRPSDSLTASAS